MLHQAEMCPRAKGAAWIAIKATIVVVFIVFSIFPIYYSVLNSFRHVSMITDLAWVPTGLSLENWRTALVPGSLLPRWVLNSIFVSTTVSMLSLCFNSLAGYAFARLAFWGRDTLFLILIFCLAVPLSLLIIPIFTMAVRSGLYDTYAALILPSASVLGLFLMRQAIAGVPKELDDAARLDGCSDFGVFWYVILPLVKPSLAAVFIIDFIGQWNWFIYPLIVTNSDKMRTLTLALYSVANQSEGSTYPPDWGLSMVLVTVAFVPVFVMFISFQKYFTKGFIMSGTKD
jgi:multiple sugar transport system permease protein